MIVHCSGCPIVKVCPAKSIIGDYDKDKGDGAEPPKQETPPEDKSAG